MKFIAPLIVVEEIKRSRFFYENILKQKVKSDFGENISFEGDFSIHLRSHFEQLIDDKQVVPGKNNIELYFENDYPEEIVLSLINFDIKIVHKLREQPWKQRVVRFYDPDGTIIEVGESMEATCVRLFKEGFSWSEIHQQTGMPEEFIENLRINHNR